MKFSNFYAPTTKDAPRDAVLASHILLSRAGYIQQLGAGLYSYLPLGVLTLERISEVVHRHMRARGANCCNLSFVCPQSYWDESGRSAKFGKELLRFRDRKEAEFVLSPTAEEAIVALVRGRVSSYKQLPLNLYQVQTKFRDEARPRFGLLRAREFVMKDAYSFHASVECLEREFANMKAAYEDILRELNLPFAVVQADSGAIGGSGSEEFMVLSPVGEDDLLLCECGYCANVEAAKRAVKRYGAGADDGDCAGDGGDCAGDFEADFAKFHTPNVSKIAELAAFFRCGEHNFCKAVAKRTIFEDGARVVVFFLRGTDELNEAKACNACGALELADAEPAELEAAGLVSGFIGPLGLDGVDFYIDAELRGQTLIAGANEKDYHFVGLKITSFNEARYRDLITVREGDSCPHCGRAMSMRQGIEVGHIFKLGSRYSETMGATFLDENGRAKPYIMGCYGIGISRLLAVIAECFCDDLGLKFPRNLAPFELVILISDIKNPEQVALAERLYTAACAAGLRVLLDDRAERFGSKIKDFELQGMPNALIIGKRLAEGKIQLRRRADGAELELPADASIAEIIANLGD